MTRRDQSVEINEQSPLIRAENTAQNGDVAERPLSEELGWEDSIMESKSSWYLLLLTLSIGGLQIVWSVELSNGSPYLLSLGMSKALLAFVWLAGPLTGALVQPYIGILSDRCRVSWGKRKPFMIAGSLGTVGSSFILAYARDIVRVFGGIDTQAPYDGGYKVATIVLATVMMWCLDFAINTGKEMDPGLFRRRQLTATSPGRNPSIHCRQCPRASAGICQCVGLSDDWDRKCSRLCFWVLEPASLFPLLWQHTIQGARLHCVDRAQLDGSD